MPSLEQLFEELRCISTKSALTWRIWWSARSASIILGAKRYLEIHQYSRLSTRFPVRWRASSRRWRAESATTQPALFWTATSSRWLRMDESLRPKQLKNRRGPRPDWRSTRQRTAERVTSISRPAGTCRRPVTAQLKSRIVGLGLVFMDAPKLLELTFIPASDDSPLRSPEYQKGLRGFADSLERVAI